jgi:hypothetical protein
LCSVQGDSVRLDSVQLDRGGCMPDRPRGKTMMINVVMIPGFQVCLQSGWPKSRRAKGLRWAQVGSIQPNHPPLPPQAAGAI